MLNIIDEIWSTRERSLPTYDEYRSRFEPTRMGSDVPQSQNVLSNRSTQKYSADILKKSTYFIRMRY